MAKLNDIFAVLEKVAPVALSDEFCKKYGLYDNSGIIVNCGEEVNGALFSLDFSLKAVREAINKNYNLIVTHHPAIYGGINRLDTVNNPQAKAFAECIKHGISVISMHLNFDAAPEGIDYNLMRGLGGENPDILDGLPCGGYGRVYKIKPCKFQDYAKAVAKEFNTSRALYYGDGNKTVKKVASFCGAGCDDKAMAFAKNSGADVFVSSDMKHHEIAALLEDNINVIHMTHYASENYGFNKIYLKVKDELNVSSAYFTDGELI
ncbi:MAG: Nif3-like dinuclear metal center hexameric protein [Clostridia bacterium]|nr:Nif3-like dinuclear metal center hexameric protein [Clostridia bacterium]